ncbi:MAG: 50S ribosomal protein L29 [Gammaproteobacteria bacterium]
MKPQEIRAMSDETLGEELLKLRREQFNMRLNSATGQGTRPDQFGKIRKDIARIKTILRERVGVEVSGQSE